MNDRAQKLQTFLSDFALLERIQRKIQKFNPFDVLNVATYEIRHSNVIAWLLDPAGSHAFGDLFLKRILLQALARSSRPEHSPLAVRLYAGSLASCTVFRERYNIDILVNIESIETIVCIENKVFAGEGNHQLSGYRSAIQARFPHYMHVFLYLTLGGSEPSDDHYIAYSYSDLKQDLQDMLDLRSASADPNVVSFVKHYTDTISRLTMDDQELRDLCKTIYRKHREAIDTIYEYGSQSGFSEAAEQFLKLQPSLQSTYANRNMLWFIPRSLNASLPRVSLSWNSGLPFGFWYGLDTARLRFFIEVGIFENPNDRRDFLLSLRAAGFKVTDYVLQPERKYSKVASFDSEISAAPTEDEILNSMNFLWAKAALDSVQRFLKAVERFDWSQVTRADGGNKADSADVSQNAAPLNV